jgi:hopanoid C-2 methylase
MRAESGQTSRRILCVFPRYTKSFGTFENSYSLMDGVQAFMLPQGLLLIAAYLPEEWSVRFVDENIRPAAPEDFQWADAVFVSGMHIQRAQMNDICHRAHAYDLPAAIGGPSVSACPDYYPAFDYLHVGELGDATDQLIARIAHDAKRPKRQVIFTTEDRLDMALFPIPAYELAECSKYLLGNIQYSSGCPYQCEFCDIPGLYGRNPRLKTPDQILAELDRLLECGIRGSIYFVDDNFIGNRKAALELLPHLVEWQKRTGFAIQLACEATLNIAKRPEILELMREAYFTTIFCGIETPDPTALKAMHKDHNMMVPILEGVRTISSYGIEVVSGIILGLDTDTPETGQFLMQFIEQSQIPLLTINLLQALPKTPLWDRLAREGRLIDDPGRDSNVDFLMPYDQVVAMWKDCMARAYQPEALLSRYAYQIENSFVRRLQLPPTPQRASKANIKRGLIMLRNIIWQIGVRGDYKWAFWKFALPLLLRGRLENFLATTVVAHHLIIYAREASQGVAVASNYSLRLQQASVPAE